jgi:hypothetical protein
MGQDLAYPLLNLVCELVDTSGIRRARFCCTLNLLTLRSGMASVVESVDYVYG